MNLFRVKLDPKRALRENFRTMWRALILLWTTGFLVAGDLAAQGVALIERKPVPLEIFNEATEAVRNLGAETMKGNGDYIYETMYPRMRKRATKQLGSEKALREKLNQIPEQMDRMGLQLTAFRAEPALSGFEIPEFREWLIFVPTVRTIRAIDSNGNVLLKKIRDFQVAVRPQDKAEWSFINGSKLKVRELRRLFPSLPANKDDLGWPEVGLDP